MQPILPTTPSAEKIVARTDNTELQQRPLALLFADAKVVVTQTNTGELSLQFPTSKLTLKIDGAKIVLPEGKNQQFFTASLSESTDPQKHTNLLVSYLNRHSVVQLSSPATQNFKTLLNAIKASVPGAGQDTQQSAVTLQGKVEKSTAALISLALFTKPAASLNFPLGNPTQRPVSGDKIQLQLIPSKDSVMINWLNDSAKPIQLASLSNRSSSYDAVMLTLLKMSGLTLKVPELTSLTSLKKAPVSEVAPLLFTSVKLTDSKLALNQALSTPIVQYAGDADLKSPLEWAKLPKMLNAFPPRLQDVLNTVPVASLARKENVNAIEALLASQPTTKQTSKPALLASLPQEQKQLIHSLLLPLIRQTLPLQEKPVSMESVLNDAEKAINSQTGQRQVSVKQPPMPWQPLGLSTDGSSEISKKEAKVPTEPDKKPALTSFESTIKSMINTPALPLTSASVGAVMSQSSSGSSFVATLIAILQSLATSKASSRTISSGTSSKAMQTAAETIAASVDKKSVAKPAASPAARSESQQVANEANLLRQIASLLSNHQQAKLRQADAAINGQDQLHYILPALFGSKTPVELLIKKDSPDSKDKDKSQQKQNSWHLTMKLDVGDLGTMLAKTHLSKNTASIDIYAEAEPLIKKVKATMHILESRLKQRGLQIELTRVQAGVIPDSLSDKSIQLLETLV